jgi:hypothetical protein
VSSRFETATIEEQGKGRYGVRGVYVLETTFVLSTVTVVVSFGFLINLSLDIPPRSAACHLRI